MARSDNLRADIERIGAMPDEEFAERWGDWARERDRDLGLLRQRWLADLTKALPFAEQEEAALAELVAAKDAHRADPTPATRERRDVAVAAVQEIRSAERAGRGKVPMLAGDAFVMGN